MQNLYTNSITNITIPKLHKDTIITCIDFLSHKLFIACYSLQSLIIYNFQLTKIIKNINLSSQISKSDIYINITYLPEMESICLLTKSGNVFLIETESPHNIKKILEFNQTTLFAEWDPEKDLYAITTETKISLMTNTWETVGTHEYSKNLSKDQEKTDSISKPIYISWRKDSQFFAVLNQKDEHKRIIVYNRICSLIFISKYILNCIPLIQWIPDGSLIATSTTDNSSNPNKIIFFEKNCLRNGEFDLIDSDCEIIEIKWNYNSSILALNCIGRKKNYSVELWRRDNYNWYLKKKIMFKEEIHKLYWDTNYSRKLWIIDYKGNMKSLEFCWKYDICIENDYLLGIVDGKKLYITFLGKHITPPPMYNTKLTLPQFISEISTFHNLILILTNDNNITLYQLPKSNNKQPKNHMTPTHKTIINLNNYPYSFFRSLKLLNYNQFILIAHTNDNIDHLLLFNFDKKEFKLIKFIKIKINHLSTNKYSSLCYDLNFNKKENSLYLQMYNGEIYKILFKQIHNNIIMNENNNINNNPIFIKTGKFKSRCHIWDIIKFYDQQSEKKYLINSEETLIGIDLNNRLYIGGKSIHHKCTSISVHESFLLFTTESNQSILFFMPRNQTIKSHLCDLEAENILNCRLIEKFSILLINIPESNSVILSSHRGNLEVIYPKPFLLSYIKKLLEKNEYNKSMKLMIKHSINLNFIYDIDPGKFERNIGVFMDTLNNNEYLDMFINSLSTESYSKDAGIINKIDKKKNVNEICRFLIREMKKRGRELYRIPVVTAYVKSNKIDEGLDFIREIGAINSKHKETLIKHIIFLTHVDKIYKSALGLYDFELAMFILSIKKEFDPKEYIPFLTKLKNLNENECRYEINLYLSRYDKALHYLSKLPNRFENCLDLITKHHLYNSAFKIWNRKSDEFSWKIIMKNYGNYISKTNLDLAARIYLLCEEYQSSLNCYKKSSDYKNALLIAKIYKLEDVKSLAFKLSNKMKIEFRYEESAEILVKYCDDVKSGILCLVEGKCWWKAIMLATKNDMEYLIEDEMKDLILEDYKDTCLYVKEIRDKYKNNINHLKSLQKANNYRYENSDDESTVKSFNTNFTWNTISTLNIGVALEKNQQSKKKNFKLKEKKEIEVRKIIKSIISIFKPKNYHKKIKELIDILLFLKCLEEAKKLKKEYKRYVDEIRVKDLNKIPFLDSYIDNEQISGEKEYKWYNEIYHIMNFNKSVKGNEKFMEENWSFIGNDE